MASYTSVPREPDHELSEALPPWHVAYWSEEPDFDPYNDTSTASLRPTYPDWVFPPARKLGKGKWTTFSLLCGLMIIVAAGSAVTIPLILLRQSKSGSSESGSPSSSNTPQSTGAISGVNGSVVTTNNGSTFIYINNFGGDWAYDPTSPFSSGGKAQNWSPRVGNETWDWGIDIARGVNLGGWLVTEPFITPSLYEKYINSSSIAVVDEWTLSMAMGQNLATEMENHYATFITEVDFANIAAAGLNWVRIPIGFWAIETMGDEPFLVGKSWNYFLFAIQWARKYGIRIFLDLHALPGSQNGWNHSGKAGSVNFMNGVMGLANAQRTLTYLRILVEFVSQEQYRDVVGVLGIVNEILWSTIGQTDVQSFYLAAYETIRTSTGTGDGSGPYIAIHDGFQGPAIWAGFLSGADRLALDQHPYLAFLNSSLPIDQMAAMPCQWALATNQSSSVFGVTLGGEFSSAINDCGLWLNGIGSTPAATDCAMWDNWAAYNPATINSILQLSLASMDALQNFFFWTWKVGESTVLGTSSSPLWHYQLGLAQGWIPSDPREAMGHCATILASSLPFDGIYPASATGGPGAGTIEPAQLSSVVFPPTTMAPSFVGTQIALLPTFTPTGAIKTLTAPTFTAAPTVSVGDGWDNDADTASAYVPVSGCSYPSAWDAVNATLPTAPCTG